MNKRYTFLDILTENIAKLQEQGIIKEDELKKGINMPIEWLYTSGIDRQHIIGAMESICSKANPQYKSKTKLADKITKVQIIKKHDEIIMTIKGRDGWTMCNVTNTKESTGRIKNITTEQFIKEIYAQKVQSYMRGLMESLKLSEEDARQVIVQLFNETQKVNDLNGLSESLCEMSENLGVYYAYMYEQKQQADEADKGPDIIHAGIVQIGKDEKTYIEDSHESKTYSSERKQNVDYEYEERNRIFMEQNPIKIISFDTIEDRSVNPNSYVSYVFKNPRQNKGHFLIIEPTVGNKDGRIVYLQEGTIENHGNKEDENEIWKEIATKYIELSKKEFLNQGHSAIYYHTTIEAFKEKFEYILSDKRQKTTSVIQTARRSLRKLFGTEVSIEQLSYIAQGVTLDDMNNAKKEVLGEKEKTEETEK